MTIGPNGPWYTCLPDCEALVPCGTGQHAVRWEAFSLRLPQHPDAEGELVLAALGGEKAGCIELAEAWGRHNADLSVLAIGPRRRADEISVSWDDVAAAAQAGQAVPGGTPQPRPRRLAPGPRVAGHGLGPVPPGQRGDGAGQAAPERHPVAARPGLRLPGPADRAGRRGARCPPRGAGGRGRSDPAWRWSPRSRAGGHPPLSSGSASTPTRWSSPCTTGRGGDRSS